MVGQRLAVGWSCLAESKKGEGELEVFLGKIFFLHLVMLHFRGPLKRGFMLPEKRPENVVFDAALEVFFVILISLPFRDFFFLFLSFLSFSCVSFPNKTLSFVLYSKLKNLSVSFSLLPSFSHYLSLPLRC